MNDLLAGAIKYIEDHIERVTESGCWIWIGSISDKGYGNAWFNCRVLRAHRLSYQSIVGEIPEDKPQLDHLCRVRCCVNPAHLEPVTARENVHRGIGLTSANAKKTHCAKGHLLPDYTSYNGKRERKCMPCQREWFRLKRQGIKEREIAALAASKGEKAS